MKKRLPLLLSALVLVGGLSCGDDDSTEPVNNTVTFTANLTAGDEVPPPTVGTSTPSGTFTATLDTVTNVMVYDVSFSGLTSNVNNGHIHGPADAGVAAAALLNFNTWPGSTFSFGQTSGTAHGTATLTSATEFTATVRGDSLRKLLFAGKAYANIHTVNNPQGEIRGQITKK